MDNDVFVPHGYLSDDEGIEEDGDSEDESSKSKVREVKKIYCKLYFYLFHKFPYFKTMKYNVNECNTHKFCPLTFFSRIGI